jgi:hypothetical protein
VLTLVSGKPAWAPPVVNGIDLGSILSSDETYKGITISGYVDANTVGFGGVLSQQSDFNFDDANAGAEGTSKGLVIALESGTAATKTLLLFGQVCDTGWSWSAGPVYLDTTDGQMTQTAPSSSGNFVVPIGIALSSTTILFLGNNTTLAEVA